MLQDVVHSIGSGKADLHVRRLGAYDERRSGTQLQGALRCPANERTGANKGRAIGYAADLSGRLLGRMVAAQAWSKSQAYFNGELRADSGKP
jgi:hypothetical protein